ncbi:MAG: hypothetical protein Q9162_000709 [Coniocarpon cinnabarinum]
MVQSWPAVLGVDAAVVVDSVGASVKSFKPGDDVFTLCGMSTRAGAYQEVITVPEFLAAKKPSNVSFEEAASLPIASITGAAIIHLGLHVPLPYFDLSEGTNHPTSILVLGGSSAIGAAAIQFLRLAIPQATILTTSSIHHHEHLLSLGATKCFERAAQDEPDAIKAATPGGFDVDAILDPITAALQSPSVFSTLSPAGLKLYSHVVTGQNPDVPEGVTSTSIFGRKLLEAKGGINMMAGLASLVQSGQYRLPVRNVVTSKGLDSLEQGLEKLQKGVSGAKYVVSL